MAKTIPLVDLTFFLLETKSSPTHVAALMLFQLPDDAGKRYVAELAAAYRKGTPAPPFNWVPEFPALGMPRWLALRCIIIPQAVRLVIPPVTNDFIALFKDSSLVSVITVVELTKQTSIFATNIASWAVPGALCAGLYLAMSLPLARLARRLEGRWKAASS